MFLVIDVQAAKEMGMTHHGRMYGVPVWTVDTPGEIWCVPKLWIARHYFTICELLFDAAHFLCPFADFSTPYELGDRIK